MSRSLAIWYDSSQPVVEDHSAQIELHFNIWKDLPAGDALDIGVLLKESRTIEQFYIYIPAKIPAGNLRDLAPLLLDQTTLSAVFNDLLVVGAETPHSIAVNRGTATAFHITKLDLNSDVDIGFIDEGTHTGTIVTIKRHVFKRMHEVGHHYFRLRLDLRGELSSLFQSDDIPTDHMFLSSFYRTEIIEFRINERRNYSTKLREQFPTMAAPTIDGLHYFLVRKTSADLVRAHADFRKMRRLEQDLWIPYLKDLGDPNPSPESMIIYHWRELGTSREIDSYIALAIFRKARANLYVYVLMIILLGATGSAVQAVLSATLVALAPCISNWGAQIATLTLLALGIWLAYIGRRRLGLIDVAKGKGKGDSLLKVLALRITARLRWWHKVT
jgi:hypothetical protein